MERQTDLVALVRKKAGKSGFFRACLGGEVADAMANSQMDDETTLQTAYAFAKAIQDLEGGSSL